MTKGQIIESALLNVLGGDLSADANVLRADVAAYLPAVVAAAMRAEAFERRAEARAEMAVHGFASAFPPVEFYKELVVDPVKDGTTDRWYVALPALVDLPNGWNVLAARPEASFSVDFIRARSFQEMISAEDIPQLFFFLRRDQTGVKMFFNRMPQPIQPVVVTAAVSPAALSNDEQLPLPLSVEERIVPMLVGHFRQQRGMPADPVADDKDVNDGSGIAMPAGRARK